jgi:hypothetical protein
VVPEKKSVPNDAITPFTLAVPQADLEDLNRRFRHDRIGEETYFEERFLALEATSHRRLAPTFRPSRTYSL